MNNQVIHPPPPEWRDWGKGNKFRNKFVGEDQKSLILERSLYFERAASLERDIQIWRVRIKNYIIKV